MFIGRVDFAFLVTRKLPRLVISTRDNLIGLPSPEKYFTLQAMETFETRKLSALYFYLFCDKLRVAAINLPK